MTKSPNRAPTVGGGDAHVAQEVAKLVGAVNGLTVGANLNLATRAQILRKLKQEGLYKSLSGSWEEFCAEHLPISKTTADNLVRELERLGEEFLSASAHLGLGQRQMVSLASLPKGLLPRAEGDEIVVGEERVPLAEKGRVVELLEELLAEQDKLRMRIERGEDQLTKKVGENRELKEQLKRIEDARAGRLTAEYDHRAIQAIKALREFADCLSDDDLDNRPHPEVVLNYFAALERSFSEIWHYAAQYVTPEWMTDPDAMRAHMKDVLERGPHGAAAVGRPDQWGDEDQLL